MNDIMKMYLKAQNIKVKDELLINQEDLNEILNQAVWNVLPALKDVTKSKISTSVKLDDIPYITDEIKNEIKRNLNTFKFGCDINYYGINATINNNKSNITNEEILDEINKKNTPFNNGIIPEIIYRKNINRENREEEIVEDYKSIIIKECNDKINFIDKNDIFVGFDYYRSCCEDFGWYLSRKMHGKAYIDKEELEGYFFDINRPYTEHSKYDLCKVSFRLIHPTKKAIYLTLFNEHNGYYAHDVFMKDKEDKFYLRGHL